jgi:hypothetical protein
MSGGRSHLTQRGRVCHHWHCLELPMLQSMTFFWISYPFKDFLQTMLPLLPAPQVKQSFAAESVDLCVRTPLSLTVRRKCERIWKT